MKNRNSDSFLWLKNKVSTQNTEIFCILRVSTKNNLPNYLPTYSVTKFWKNV